MGLKLIAELGLDGSGFASGLRKAEGLAASAGNSIRNTLVGLVGVGTISLAIQKTVESCKELAIASERLEIGVKQLQVLRKAAADAGIEFGKLEKTFEKIDVARFKALTPGSQGQEARRTFAQLGVTPEMLRSMSASQLFMGPMAQAFKGGSAAQLGPLLQQLGLKDFGAIIPVLKTNFTDLEATMTKYGAIVDALTIVKMKHLGDEFDLIAKIMVGVLGPALVAFGDWLLKLISTEGSFLNRVIEGVDYRGREAAGMAKLPEGAAKRYEAGQAALDMMQRTDYKTTTPEQFTAQWKDYYTKGLGRDRNPEYATMFDSFEGKTWKELQKHVSGMIQPVSEVQNTAAKGATADMAAFRDSIADFNTRMQAEADELNNPKHKDDKKHGDREPRSLKSLEVPSDSLTRVGNFLGGSQNAIMRLAEQRTQYLRQIAQDMGVLTSQRNRGSALGNPNAVFVPTH